MNKEKKQSVIENVMTRATDFVGKPFEVDREMDIKSVEPVVFGGSAFFAEDEEIAAMRAGLQALEGDEREALLRQIDEKQQAAAATRAKKRVVTFKTSTSGLDRHGTRIRTEGIDTGNYEKNPIFAWGHDAYGSFFGPPDIENIIGRCVGIRKGLDMMEQDIEFCTADINPRGDRAYAMVVGRYLGATSIGFIPKQIVVEMEDEQHIPVITKAELLEASLVPIPSNPEALALVRAMAKADFAQRGVTLQWACRHQHIHVTVEEAEACNAKEIAPTDRDTPPASAAAAGASDLVSGQVAVGALKRAVLPWQLRDWIRRGSGR